MRAPLRRPVFLLAATAACARPGPPPGGTPDKTPPAVVATEPANLAVLPALKGRVKIEFDERLSERGFDNSVILSPSTGVWEAHRGGDEISVEMKGGWRAGTIYRLLVLPTVQDLFGNTLASPIELVFSTGPEIPETVLGGVLMDRLTGKPVQDARVEAVHLPDSLTYVGASDEDGVWVMRHVPEGDYLVRAFLDQNHSRALDPFEARDSLETVVSAADTALMRLALLPRDTTPAQVARAEATDSLHVKVTLDDYVDPETPLTGVAAELWRLPDSTRVPVAEVVHGWVLEQQIAAAKAAADSVRAVQEAAEAAALQDSLASAAAAADTGAVNADSTAAARDSIRRALAAREVAPPRPARPAPTPRKPAVPGAAADTTEEEERGPLPARELIVISGQPLEVGATYRVIISGITNIAGLSGGGGTATFQVQPPATTPAKLGAPTPPGAPPDTATLRPDTTLVPDTARVPAADTTSAPPEPTASRR